MSMFFSLATFQELPTVVRNTAMRFVSRLSRYGIDITTPTPPQGTQPFLSQQTLLGFVCAVLIGVIVAGLCIHDGLSWPKAILAGLGAGGATLIGVAGLLGPEN